MTTRTSLSHHAGHNRFENVSSRPPSLRFGTGHSANDYFRDVGGSAIHFRMGTQFLVQNNVFGKTGTGASA
ncbi:MAG TPA: hypothetical protein VJT49_29295 [Amycolatopsis sp.]|uniref:pectate lyase family protein n=1 Tax=Amycolatopsis sp. TaxID=37632 RepID=UPI002B46DF10|nr:hypothetical protein [Amycolatopsis sp.]HKS49134.1 hypothetical protein [Amycolatopsis sp.]